jgi:hypothetical protein
VTIHLPQHNVLPLVSIITIDVSGIEIYNYIPLRVFFVLSGCFNIFSLSLVFCVVNTIMDLFSFLSLRTHWDS